MDPGFCRNAVDRAVCEFGRLDIIVSNAAHQKRKNSLEELDDEEWDRTFKTNVYAYFRLVKAALPHLHAGSSLRHSETTRRWAVRPNLKNSRRRMCFSPRTRTRVMSRERFSP